MTAASPTTVPVFGVLPGAVPLLGHAPRILRGPMAFLRLLAGHGDLVEIRIGPRPVTAVCHPDLVHQVLADGRTFDKGGHIFDRARLVVGNGLVTCEHAVHRRQRRLVQPAFSADRFPGYAKIMTDEIGAALDSWRPGQVIDVVGEMHRITARVTATTMFAADLDAGTIAEIIGSTDAVAKGIYYRMLMPAFLERLPTPGNVRFDRSRDRLNAIVDRLIDTYRRERADHGDLLSMLLSAQEGDGLTDEEVRDQVMTLLLSGIETTATALTWTLHLLSDRPDLVNRLHEEAGLGDRVATWGDLPRLDLATRVLAESLRLYPPVWILTRVATRDTSLAGHRIPAGSTLLLSPIFTHYRQETFDRPDRFDPDRWPAGIVPTAPRGTLIPFGGGARKCIGENFGMTEAILILSSIVARWQLAPVPGMTVRIASNAVLSPRSLRLRVERHREPSGAGHE